MARLSGTSTRTIKELNPALHRGVVPPHGYAVRVPKGTKATFEIAYATFTRKTQGHPLGAVVTKTVAAASPSAFFANFGG